MSTINQTGIDYDNLVVLPIKNTGIYKQNYKILYDKTTDQCFCLWSSPYARFITLYKSIREANNEYIEEHFKSGATN